VSPRLGQVACSDFIANVLEQRERLAPPPGPLHLTSSQDLLDVELAPADSSDRLLCRSSVEDHSEVFSLFASRIQPICQRHSVLVSVKLKRNYPDFQSGPGSLIATFKLRKIL
jgi:hypothetical protein